MALNLEILAYEESPLGPLCLRRRELLSQPGVNVTEVTLNHEFLMSSLYTDSEETLARVALERVAGDGQTDGDGLRVLVGGLGLGYTAHAALRSERVAHVEVIDLLPQVIAWTRSGLVPLSEELAKATAAGRLTLTEGDAYARLAEPDPAEKFDAILIDIDHSPDERLDEANSLPFYTAAGLKVAAKHLAPGGVLAVWSYAESGPFADALREVFVEVTVEPVSYLNEMIDERRTDWLFFARG